MQFVPLTLVFVIHMVQSGKEKAIEKIQLFGNKRGMITK